MSDLIRSGRGGAGNFHAKKNSGQGSLPQDLESQIQSESPSINCKRGSFSQPPPEYLHTGRGGAGNWVQPKELRSQGLTQASTLSGWDGDSKTLGSSKPNYRGGRGGAGNYTDFEAEERERKEAEERKRLEVERAVLKDVESGLARPERVYGKGESWEMGRVSGQDKP